MRAPNARKRARARNPVSSREFGIKKTKNCTTSVFHGDCCCNCVNLVLVNRHPTNRSHFAKGNISETVSYGCSARYGDEDENRIRRITLNERGHGMCELHVRNEKNTD